MPIQIPDLKRFNPVEPASVGRLKAEIPDSTKQVAKTNEMLGDLGKGAVDYLARIEREQIDVEATKRENSYETAFAAKLSQAKASQGDPTEVYNKLDSDMKEYFDQLAGDENLPARTKEAVVKKLSNTANRLQLQRLSEQGNQQIKYEDAVDKASIDLKKKALMEATTHIDPSDKSSFSMFDGLVGEITQTHLGRASKRGGATLDENGVVTKLGPVAHDQLGKDISEGVYNAMDNLIKAGQLEKAKALKERYWQYLEPNKQTALSDDFAKGEVESLSYRAAYGGKMTTILDGITDPVKREKVRDEALKLQDSRQQHIEAQNARASKGNYNQALNYINDITRKDPTAFAGGIIDMEKDDTLKRLLPRITDAKQKQAVFDAVVQPKETNEAARANYQNILFGTHPDYPEGLVGVSPEDMQGIVSRMNKSDQKKAWTKYESFNSETGAEKQQHMKAAGGELFNQLAAVGYIRRNRYNPARPAFEQEGKLTNAQNEFIDQIDKLGLDPKQTKDEARKFALAKIKNEVYQPPEKRSFKGDRKNAPSSGFVEPDQNGLVKGKTYKEWGIEYRKQFGSNPSLYSLEFQNFIKGQK